MTNPKKTKLQPLTINVPADVLHLAKIACACNRRSLSAVLSEYLRDVYIPGQASLLANLVTPAKSGS